MIPSEVKAQTKEAQASFSGLPLPHLCLSLSPTSPLLACGMAGVTKERQETDNGYTYPPVSPLRVVGHPCLREPSGSLLGGRERSAQTEEAMTGPFSLRMLSSPPWPASLRAWLRLRNSSEVMIWLPGRPKHPLCERVCILCWVLVCFSGDRTLENPLLSLPFCHPCEGSWPLSPARPASPSWARHVSTFPRAKSLGSKEPG